jgi:hypothetical protein
VVSKSPNTSGGESPKTDVMSFIKFDCHLKQEKSSLWSWDDAISL